jgi:hypothetical protein
MAELESPNRSMLGGIGWDGLGPKQRFTKPLPAGQTSDGLLLRCCHPAKLHSRDDLTSPRLNNTSLDFPWPRQAEIRAGVPQSVPSLTPVAPHQSITLLTAEKCGLKLTGRVSE